MVEKRPHLIWRFFSSVRLTIVLLIILAATSIFGTIIPQQEAAMEYIQRSNPKLVSLLNSLQLFNMYHSVWFRLFAFLLAANLIICSLNRFPSTLRLFRHVSSADRSRPFKELSSDRTLQTKGTVKDAGNKVIKVLRAGYRNIGVKETDKATFVYGEKGKYSLFGVYLVHASVLIILIGAILGSLFGFKGYVNIVEGESADTVVLRKPFKHEHKKLPFRIYCDKFFIDFYDNGMPKEYRSDLRFTSDGNTVQEGTLLVNHPISFQGITFYLASYGVLPGEKAQLHITKNHNDSDNLTMEVELGKPVPLPDGDGQFVVSEIRNDFMRLGTAALIIVSTGKGQETRFWIFKDYERLKKRLPDIFEKFSRLDPSAFKPYTFYLTDVESRYYTGLQVNRDPGVVFVYTGFISIMIGLFITFFVSFRRVWIRIMERDGVVDVSVAGKANKNPVGMERELDQLVHRLQKHVASKKEI